MRPDDFGFTAADAVEAAMRSMKARRGLVRIDAAGNVVMRTNAGSDYEFTVRDAGDALRWIEHIASKSWCTATHLQVFASLAADHFGVRYR